MIMPINLQKGEKADLTIRKRGIEYPDGWPWLGCERI